MPPAKHTPPTVFEGLFRSFLLHLCNPGETTLVKGGRIIYVFGASHTVTDRVTGG